MLGLGSDAWPGDWAWSKKNHMENRRQDYRHTFAPPRQLRVELHAPGRRVASVGDIVDLSVGGMKIRLHEGTPPLALAERCWASSTLPVGDLQLALHATVVHVQMGTSGCYYGLHFLPSVDPCVDEKREQAIWRFLLEEQRRALRQRYEDASDD